MQFKSVILPIFTFCIPICLSAQEQKASTPFSYRVETSVSVADGRSLRTVFARAQKCLPACRCAMAEGMATRMEGAGGCRPGRRKESDCGFLCATGLYGCCMEGNKDEHRE